jgi:hypothetical protein
MIPASTYFDQSTLATLLNHDPLVCQYRAFFALLDWSLVHRFEQSKHGSRGRPSHSLATYLKAFLVRIREGLLYTTQLRRFLLSHPLLIIELGFALVPDASALYGFDSQATLPCDYWFRQQLRHLDSDLLQALLQSTVSDLMHEIPGLGETVAFDVKHLYAWVKENNLRAYVADRFDKTRIPAGDPDCKLGVKRSSNQEQPDGSSKEKKEALWGYGSGVAAATTPDYGDVVLAEYTQAFNEADVTYFRPLYQRTVLALGQYATNITADAAFDAWYVYETAARHGGIGAVPLNQHAHPVYQRTADGIPICPHGFTMQPTFQFQHTNGYRAQRFRCPLLVPLSTDQTCDHPQFQKGCGCVKDVNWELGGKMRVSLDRSSPLYQGIYRQRTSCERINSHAKELGIERPKVRNRRSVEHLNTLIYVIINLKALQRARAINARLLAF